MRNKEHVVAILNAMWDEINTLGGAPVQENSYDQGIVDTVAKVLEIVERQRALIATGPRS